MKRRVSDLKAAQLLVVGDVMLDRYWSGSTTRVSPEAPVPIVRVNGVEERMGGAANVAANAAALGAAVTLVGVAGMDADGERLIALCRAAGIATFLHRSPQTRTTVKLRVLAQHQQLLRLDFEAAWAATESEALLGLIAPALADVDAVVLSDYAKGALQVAPRIIELARQAGKTIVVDPKGRDFARYAGADLITPNQLEFEAVVGSCADEEEIGARGRSLCEQHAFGALLITRGERGMTLIRPHARVLHLAAQARDVYDVTGAGDTVCAAVGTALAAGLTLEDAVTLANAAAGLAVAKLGTAVVGAAELAAALPAALAAASLGLSRTELLGEIAAARRRGERVVMTNGCFDILHAGHVRYLEAAAKLGDRLLVAVNSDDSVRRLKGPDRPVNGLAERMEVLRGLKSVDWVVAFDEDTPRDLIATVAPAVLVKGGDYEVANIAGSREVIALGGEIVTLPYFEGLSTSRVIAAARDGAQPGPQRR